MRLILGCLGFALVLGCGDDTGGVGGAGGGSGGSTSSSTTATSSSASTSTAETSTSEASSGAGAGPGGCEGVCADVALCDDDDDCISSCESLREDQPDCFPSLAESAACNATQDCSGEEACLLPSLELGLCVGYGCVSDIDLGEDSCTGDFACDEGTFRYECVATDDTFQCTCFSDEIEVGTCEDVELGCYLLTGCCGEVIMGG